MENREFLSKKEIFSKFYTDALSDCPRDNANNSKDESSSKYNSDTDDVNIRVIRKSYWLILILKVKIILAVAKNALLLSQWTSEWIEYSISQKLGDFIGITILVDKTQSDN